MFGIFKFKPRKAKIRLCCPMCHRKVTFPQEIVKVVEPDVVDIGMLKFILLNFDCCGEKFEFKMERREVTSVNMVKKAVSKKG